MREDNGIKHGIAHICTVCTVCTICMYVCMYDSLYGLYSLLKNEIRNDDTHLLANRVILLDDFACTFALVLLLADFRPFRFLLFVLFCIFVSIRGGGDGSNLSRTICISHSSRSDFT